MEWNDNLFKICLDADLDDIQNKLGSDIYGVWLMACHHFCTLIDGSVTAKNSFYNILGKRFKGLRVSLDYSGTRGMYDFEVNTIFLNSKFGGQSSRVYRDSIEKIHTIVHETIHVF